MNQPTREEFDELKEEVRRIKERQTEPIGITEFVLLQTLVTMAGTNATDMALLKGEMGVLRQAVERIESNVEKRFDAIADVQKLILDRLPPKQE